MVKGLDAKMESRMIIGEDGTKKWINEKGERHRDNGPAVIWRDGKMSWWKNGKMHREDGPAVIWPDGYVSWRLNGILYSFTEWANELNLDSKQRLELVMKWNPE